MLKSLRIFFILSMVVLLTNCKKDTTETPLVIDKALTLDSVKKAYYDENNNRYETDQFSIYQDEFNYSLQTTAGNKYRVLMYDLPMTDVVLELIDNAGNVVKTGQQANVGLTSKYFVFVAVSGVGYHIHITTSNETLFDQNFFLTFEEVGTYSLSWKGENWLCDGDWEVNNNDQLMHIGHNSGFSKWAKVADASYIDCQLNLEFDVPNGGLDNFVGVAVNASDDIYDLTNLPDVARLFKFRGLNAWAVWWINIGNSGGIGNNTGYLSQPFTSNLNELECTVQSDSIRYSVNGVNEHAIFNDIYGSHRVYLTVEDYGNDTILLNDFSIN